jgi:SEC-C motif-containing protein
MIKDDKNNTLCKCGSGVIYKECCGRFIEDHQKASLPVLLMKSRYTAYALGKHKYIEETMEGKALETFNPKAVSSWEKLNKWVGLEILKVTDISEDDKVGWVEFKATYMQNDKTHILHEISEFHKIGGHWYYVDGILNPKIGRNDPCYCLSEKKYKNCCGK